MRDVAVTAIVAAGAFVGTMLDNTAALMAQLSLTERSNHPRGALGHAVGMALVVAVAATVGLGLDVFPLRAVGVLALAPAALAVHAFRHRHEPARGVRRGLLATLVTTIAFSGDNLAVWTPLFRADVGGRVLVTVAVFVVLDAGVIALSRAVAGHPRVVSFCGRAAPQLSPYLYAALTVVVLWECRLL